MRPEIYIGSLDALLRRLSDDFHAQAARATARRGFYAVALPGGSVADHALASLARLPLQWDQVHFFWVDERAVPSSDPRSNYALAAVRWFDSGQVPTRSIHRMPADAPDLAAAAAAYAAELAQVLGTPPRLDFVLLGVGPDGHVASLFPGHPASSEERRWVVAVEDSPKPPARRLTLTLPLLAGAERVVIMALGEAKAAVMQEAIEDPASPLPVAEILRRAARPLLLLDEAAAARLGKRCRVEAVLDIGVDSPDHTGDRTPGKDEKACRSQ